LILRLLIRMSLVAGDGAAVPNLIVVQTATREIIKIFPSGKLPADPLQPNTVYGTEPGSARHARRLRLYRWNDGGPKFAVFAREATP
jgi:hypothetical protein